MEYTSITRKSSGEFVGPPSPELDKKDSHATLNQSIGSDVTTELQKDIVAVTRTLKNLTDTSGKLLTTFEEGNALLAKKAKSERKQGLQHYSMPLGEFDMLKVLPTAFWQEVTDAEHKQDTATPIMEHNNELDEELAVQYMSELLFKHSQVFSDLKQALLQLPEETELKYKSIKNIERLIKDVGKLIKTFRFSLEKLPVPHDSKRTQILTQFLPAFHVYYLEQTASLYNENEYVDSAAMLEKIQREVASANNFETVFNSSRKLTFSMQRMYLLHFVAENLARHVVELEYSCKKYIPSQKHPARNRKAFCLIGKCLDLIKQYVVKPANMSEFGLEKLKLLRSAVRFRNKIAHEGKIWEPDDFKKNINYYEEGIVSMQREFRTTLDKIPIKTAKIEDFEKYFKQYDDLGISAKLVEQYAGTKVKKELLLESVKKPSEAIIRNVCRQTINGFFAREFHKEFFLVLNAFNLFNYQRKTPFMSFDPYDKKSLSSKGLSVFHPLAIKFYKKKQLSKDELSSQENTFIQEFKRVFSDNNFMTEAIALRQHDNKQHGSKKPTKTH